MRTGKYSRKEAIMSVSFAVQRFAICLILALFSAARPDAAKSQVPQDSVIIWMSELSSEDWRARALAADKLIRDSALSIASNEVLSALVRLAARENQVIDDSFARGVGVSREYGEEYGEYYGRLRAAIVAHGNLRDPIIIKTLVEGAYSHDSPFVDHIVRESGTLVLPIALGLLNRDVASKWNGLALAAALYARNDSLPLSSEDRASVQGALHEATRDPGTRRVAVELLGKAGDRSDLEVLRSIAASDPVARDHAQRGRIYPNRELAARAIRQIKARHPPR
jgi:hypothetical protein